MRAAVAMAGPLFACAGATPATEAPAAAAVRIELVSKDVGRPPPDRVLAYRDGDGPWTRLVDDALAFEVRSGRYSVVQACGSGRPSIDLYHRTTDDPGPIELPTCKHVGLGFIEGVITGVRGRAMAIERYATQEDGHYRSVLPLGQRDVIAVDGTGSPREWSSTRLAIVRDVAMVSDSDRVRLDIDLASQGVDLEHRALRVVGLARDEQASLRVSVETPRARPVHLTVASRAPLVADLPPEGFLAADDTLTIEVTAKVGASRRHGWLDGARVILPPPLGSVQVDAVSDQPPRLRFTWVPHSLTDAYRIEARQRTACTAAACDHPSTWRISLTSGYLGGGDAFVYEMPDLRSIAYWPGAFDLVPATEIEWTVLAVADDPKQFAGASRTGKTMP